MFISWLSLLPPFAVIIAASVTKKLNQSLFLGLCIGALIATGGNVVNASSLLITRMSTLLFDAETMCNYLFLFIISALIVLISQTGGALAFAHAITKRLHSRRMVEIASLLVSSTLFIDDYLSNLTAGYAIRPLSDRFAIPRAKLAYLVHALASPLVIISPISSWLAVLTGQLEKADISTTITPTTKIIAEPFMIYIQLIPFIFYSFLLIASVWFVVYAGISYGPMQEQEKVAHSTGNLFGGKKSPAESIEIQEKEHATFLDLIIPVVLLVGLIFCGFLYAGGFYLFGGSYGVLQALQHNKQTPLVLLVAGTATLIMSMLIALIRKTLTIKELSPIVLHGIEFIYSSVLMIFLVTTLSELLKLDLHTGAYLASLVQGTLALWLLPCIFFLVSTITSFVTGSTWGTIALMTSIGVQVLISLTSGTPPFYPSDIPMLLPLLGSIFAGAICGNHISPISDTTIMASTSCGAYPLDHIYTQLPYIIPVIMSTVIAFIIAGIMAPLYSTFTTLGVAMGTGLICTISLLLLANKWLKPSL